MELGILSFLFVYESSIRRDGSFKKVKGVPHSWILTDRGNQGASKEGKVVSVLRRVLRTEVTSNPG
jgi:hypothetical protein